MFKSGQKLDRLIALQEETNGLLRELVTATLGRQPATRKPGVPVRQSTEKDVRVITRQDRLRMQEEERQAQAPWREPIRGNGPASAMTLTAPLSNTSAASPVDPSSI